MGRGVPRKAKKTNRLNLNSRHLDNKVYNLRALGRHTAIKSDETWNILKHNETSYNIPEYFLTQKKKIILRKICKMKEANDQKKRNR